MEQEKKCNTCNSSKSLKKHHWIMLGVSTYILISSLYGTYKLFQLLISMFV
jgi:hypothetical protein